MENTVVTIQNKRYRFAPLSNEDFKDKLENHIARSPFK